MTIRNSIILFILIQFLACKSPAKEETYIIEGDLHFSFLRFTNLYGVPDSTANRIIKIAETKKNSNSEVDLDDFKMYEFLKKENLLYSPYIEIKTDSNSIITLFLTKEDYSKIAPTDYSQLIESKKKIRIKAEARPLSGVLHYCNKLISVKTIDGNTNINSRKFKIEDYQ